MKRRYLRSLLAGLSPSTGWMAVSQASAQTAEQFYKGKTVVVLVGTAPGEEPFDFDRVEYSASSLAEHLIDQLHGASGAEGDLARIIAEMLEETGYLTVPLSDIADMSGAPVSETTVTVTSSGEFVTSLPVRENDVYFLSLARQ